MMQVVRFKDDRRPQNKMLKATLYIQRKEGTSDTDDVIYLHESSMLHDTVEIVYQSPDLRKAKKVILSTSKAMAYVNHILKSLCHDMEPFEYVQVSTMIHPSVLYHVSDMDNREVRYLIEDMVEMALHHYVFQTRKH
jgi:hypothetical protein